MPPFKKFKLHKTQLCYIKLYKTHYCHVNEIKIQLCYYSRHEFLGKSGSRTRA